LLAVPNHREGAKDAQNLSQSGLNANKPRKRLSNKGSRRDANLQEIKPRMDANERQVGRRHEIAKALSDSPAFGGSLKGEEEGRIAP
jgi:hypothetical protein